MAAALSSIPSADMDTIAVWLTGRISCGAERRQLHAEVRRRSHLQRLPHCQPRGHTRASAGPRTLPAQSASETLDPSGPPRSAGLRRAVRIAGQVTDRALRIPYVKGTVRLPAILFTVSAVPSSGKPPGTQRGGPAGIAGTDLPYHGVASRGITQRTATRIGRAAAFATRSEPAYLSGLRAATALADQKNSRRVRAGIRRA